jgi:hypothetical protein
MALPPQINQNTDQLKDGIVTLNGYQYTYNIVMYNGNIFVRIPTSLVHELTIIDNIYSIFHYGHLILKNEFDLLGNYTTNNDNTAGVSILDTSYNFNSNIAGDILVIKIKPMNPPQNDDSLSDTDWSLSFIFSIYDEDEIYEPTSTKKLKIFKFRDVREDILSNTYLPWSTSQLVSKQNGSDFNVSQLDNSSRAVKTGDAIQDIIKSTLTTFENKFNDVWDVGNTLVFYSSPYNQSRFDTLEYILDRHVSLNTSDNSILKLERNGTWTLIPLETYFTNAINKQTKLPGDFTIDIFNLHNQQYTQSDQQSKVNIPPKSKNPYDARVSLEEFAGLFNYGFNNIANRDSTTELVTTPVHSYSIIKKLFSIDLTDSSIDSIQKKFQSMYINPMYGEPPTNSIPISPEKQQNLIYNPVFSVFETKSLRIKDGRNRVFQKMLGLSNGLTFNLEGFSIRRSGRFISLVNTGAFPETAFQNTIQGEWFITQVVHTFIGNTYRNDVTCIKPYIYKKLT